jgi:hypothetical protein
MILCHSYLPLASLPPGWCCLINGVTCNATRIISLALTSIPGQAGLPLPQSLSSLTMLTTLDLSSNKFLSAGAVACFLMVQFMMPNAIDLLIVTGAPVNIF